MEIYPQKQLAMLLAALFLGGAMGGLRMLVLAFRTLVGAYLPPEGMRARYARPLPLIRKEVPFREGKTRRAWRASVVFCSDLLFCLVFCVSLILLFYRYNDGAWRLSVPVLALGGFALFCALSGRFFARGNDYLAYLLAVVALYARVLLSLPFRLAWRVLARFLLRPACKLWARILEKRRRALSVALCRAELALAARGLLCEERKKKDVEKEDLASGVDSAVSDHSAVLRGTVRGVSPH